MKKKKVLVMLMVTAMALGSLAACSEDTSKESEPSGVSQESSGAESSEVESSVDESLEESSVAESTEESTEESVEPEVITGHSEIPETGYTAVDIKEGVAVSVLEEIVDWSGLDWEEGWECIYVIYRLENSGAEPMSFSGTLKVGEHDEHEISTPIILPGEAGYVMEYVSIPTENVTAIKENPAIILSFDASYSMDESDSMFILAGDRVKANEAEAVEENLVASIDFNLDVPMYGGNEVWVCYDAEGNCETFYTNSVPELRKEDIEAGYQLSLLMEMIPEGGTARPLIFGSVVKEDMGTLSMAEDE